MSYHTLACVLAPPTRNNASCHADDKSRIVPAAVYVYNTSVQYVCPFVADLRVRRYSSPLCDAVPCPLAAGAPFLLSVSQKLPALAPPGPYTLQVRTVQVPRAACRCMLGHARLTVLTAVVPRV